MTNALGEPPRQKEPSKTQGWATIGLALLAAAFGLYILTFVFGVTFAFGSTTGGGTVVQFLMMWALMAFLALLGLIILVAKVIVDRLSSREDSYYSNHVER